MAPFRGKAAFLLTTLKQTRHLPCMQPPWHSKMDSESIGNQLKIDVELIQNQHGIVLKLT